MLRPACLAAVLLSAAPIHPDTLADAPATTQAAPSLAGLSFTSVDKMESGRGVAGPVMAHWKITFKEKTLTWRHSDISQTLTYTLAPDGVITASSVGDNVFVHLGQYDAEKKELTWEGKVYKQE